MYSKTSWPPRPDSTKTVSGNLGAIQFRGGEIGVGGEFDIAALAEAYVYDLERQAEPLVLVIDDLHLIYDADWVAPFFYRLLLLLPAETHMLILARELPPAPMWRLRSKQRLFVSFRRASTAHVHHCAESSPPRNHFFFSSD